MKPFTSARAADMFSHATLTEAEIEAGVTSYEAIEKEAHIRGAV